LRLKKEVNVRITSMNGTISVTTNHFLSFIIYVYVYIVPQTLVNYMEVSFLRGCQLEFSEISKKHAELSARVEAINRNRVPLSAEDIHKFMAFRNRFRRWQSKLRGFHAYKAATRANQPRANQK
jgi:hypothetical protein